MRLVQEHTHDCIIAQTEHRDIIFCSRMSPKYTDEDEDEV